MIVHHDSGQRTLERRGYSSRPVGSCGTICTSVTTDASKITCRRKACAKHAPKVEQPRRVTIPIVGSLDKECGACPRLVGDGYCNLFRFDVVYQSGYYERLPECRAAEVR